MLLLAVLPFRTASSQVLLAIVVCASGLLLVREAVRAEKYSWAVVFVAIAALFNPIVPVARSGSNVLWLNGMGLAVFLTAAVAFRSGRRLTVLSITSPVAAPRIPMSRTARHVSRCQQAVPPHAVTERSLRIGTSSCGECQAPPSPSPACSRCLFGLRIADHEC